jgi:hypothetical protein
MPSCCSRGASIQMMSTANGNNRTKLSDDQRTQLMQTAIAKGIGFNHKYDGIDENGQIIEEHHKLRNGLIAAAIGGAAATGFGAAGIGPLSGMFGAGASAAQRRSGVTRHSCNRRDRVCYGAGPACDCRSWDSRCRGRGCWHRRGTIGTLGKIAGLLAWRRTEHRGGDASGGPE